VVVTDTGRGIGNGAARAGHGVGLANVRERLTALYGERGRYTLEDAPPRGARSTIEIPYEDV
jgi:LytS/YehU family sensor histidine kinase